MTATPPSPVTSPNACTRDTRYGRVITKQRKDSPRKIDLAVAAVVAYERAVATLRPEPAVSVYETRGVLTVPRL